MPNYREPQSINLKYCREKISIGLDVCAKESGDGENGVNLSEWKNVFMQKFDSRIKFLKSRGKNPISTKKSNPVLKREDVKEYLTSLQQKLCVGPNR